VANQAVDHEKNVVGLLDQLLRRFSGKVIQRFRYRDLSPQLERGCACSNDELSKVPLCVAPSAFGDVGGYRYRGTPHLRGKPIQLMTWK
jgi:hypothetical protein